MKRTITATELKNNLGKYLDFVGENHEVVVTKNGKRTVRLSPYITDYDRYFMVREQAANYGFSGLRVSYEEFMEIYRKSDLRLEFIDGEIIVRSSPSVKHQSISGNIFVLLHSHLQDGPCRVFHAPFDIHCYKEGFKDPDVVQPDLLVICDLEEKMRDGLYLGTPTLVVEILSTSTRSRDMVDKLRIYMLSGIDEYWIVDPESSVIMVYHFAQRQIAHFATHHAGDSFQSHALNDLLIDVDLVFAE